MIDNVRVSLHGAHQDGDHITIEAWHGSPDSSRITNGSLGRPRNSSRAETGFLQVVQADRPGPSRLPRVRGLNGASTMYPVPYSTAKTR
jgi:hypothetical protein